MNRSLVIDHDALPETCSDAAHIPGCPCQAGGDAEFVTLPLNAMRCEVCGHRLDDMDGCDSCAADLEAFGWSDDPDDGGRR